MTKDIGDAAPRRVRRRTIGWIVAVVVLIAAVVLAVLSGWADDMRPSAGDATSSTGDSVPTPSAGQSSTPAPTQKSTPTRSASPAPDDDAAPGARTTAPPVELDQPAKPADDVTVSLSSITPIAGRASVPGEVEGPALRVKIAVSNRGSSDALSNTLIVNLYYGPDRTPANILVSPREDLPVSIAPGQSATGIYAFSVPEDARDEVVVEVDLALDLPVVVFEGAVG